MTLKLESLQRRQLLGLAGAAILFGGSAKADAVNQMSACSPALPVSLAGGLQRIKKAYPHFIAGFDDKHLIWADGTKMAHSLFPNGRTMAEQVRNPDLASQARQSYPKGRCAIPQSSESDPGRVRYVPFFQKMYGATREEVLKNIVKVSWPSRHKNGFLTISKVNGANKALQRVADELAQLPASLHKYFDKPAGGQFWRVIAGTERLSGHAFGFAVDINLLHGDYWRQEIDSEMGDEESEAGWKPAKSVRSRIPFEIAEVFERHGFIWGGKWYHYDTPHFEYRPELV